MKHTIEIVWHKYFIAIDGVTKSPSTLSGDIGKAVSGTVFFRAPVINFATMRPKRPLPELSKEVLS